MTHRKKDAGRQQQKGILREAWENMSRDFSRLLPERMRRSGGTRKFLVFSAIIDLVVLGILGKFLYEWLGG